MTKQAAVSGIKWRTVSVGPVAHVYPFGDGVRAHVENEACWCRPKPDAAEPRVLVHSFGGE